MTNTDIFIEKYKLLEKAATEKYGFSSDGRAISQLERMPRYRNERTMLSYVRDVRNLLQHNPKIEGEYAVTPSESIIEFLDKMIIRVSNPDKCMDSAIVMGGLFYKGQEDTVFDTMEIMAKRGFSHVPILKSGKVIGVFSRNSVFELLMSGKCIEDIKQLTFSQISEYTLLDDTKSEVYIFIPKDTLIEDAEQLCEDYYKSGHRIAMLFLTEKGSADEKLLGAITPWTILGHKY